MAAVICLSMVFPAFAFYDVTLQEDGGVTGTATAELKLRDGADLTYTGSAITPAEVECGESWLGGDLTVSYDNNIDAGTATVSAAKGSAEVSLQFVISPKSAESVAVSPIPEQIYTGAPIVPSLTIKDGGTELTQGKDYTVTCSDNTAVGTAKVTVDFSGNYFGTKTVYFDIAYAELPEGSTISDYASVPSPNENGRYNGDIVITAEGGASVGFTEDTAGEVIVSDEGEGTKTIVIKDSGGRIYQTDFEYKLDKTPPTVTLEPVTDSSQRTDDGYTVFITADDSLSLVDYGSITVTKNGEPFETGSGTPNFTADENGNYMFTDVPEGVYNIAAPKDGGTVTILVTVSDSDISGADTSLGDGSKNSVVEIAGDPPMWWWAALTRSRRTTRAATL